jgi:transposase-like protein
MTNRYSVEFIEQARQKVLSRGNRTQQSVADELNIHKSTLKTWMRKMPMEQKSDVMGKAKRPCDWNVVEQFRALQETYGLSGEALHAWCRERGLFAHHLTAWEKSFCAAEKTGNGNAGDIRHLKEENAQLKRELSRKEKALSEAAALLILQKKFRALWEDAAP